MTGDEDGFVKMWDNKLGDTSVMTFKRFDGYVSSFLKIDKHHLVAASGEGTIQSFDLRRKKPDIQSEMYNGELNCMGTVRSGTKWDWTFVSLQVTSWVRQLILSPVEGPRGDKDYPNCKLVAVWKSSVQNVKLK